MEHSRVVIEGEFRTVETGQSVCTFVRWLEIANGNLVVKHCTIRVDERYRRMGIAAAHYRSAFALYREIGVSEVYLDANDFGPYVWPDFLFEFDAKAWEHMMATLEEIFATRYDSAVPFYPSTANELAALSGPDDEEIGRDVIERVLAGMGESLRMTLRLADEETIDRLESVGIL